MIHKIAAIVSDKTVANAAPATPVFNTTTNSRSSTMLSRLQNTRKISGVLESPSALKIENGVKYAATEIRLYFDIPEDAFVMHYMGEPQETRHIVMRNEEAVISPSWSIHSGSGSQAYTFIWGMVGENQDFDDMDGIANQDIM